MPTSGCFASKRKTAAFLLIKHQPHEKGTMIRAFSISKCAHVIGGSIALGLRYHFLALLFQGEVANAILLSGMMIKEETISVDCASLWEKSFWLRPIRF